MLLCRAQPRELFQTKRTLRTRSSLPKTSFHGPTGFGNSRPAVNRQPGSRRTDPWSYVTGKGTGANKTRTMRTCAKRLGNQISNETVPGFKIDSVAARSTHIAAWTAARTAAGSIAVRCRHQCVAGSTGIDKQKLAAGIAVGIAAGIAAVITAGTTAEGVLQC